MAYVRVEQRQEQIVAAAVRVLGRVGVPRTTLRAVAAEADIPLGTLHYVFPSKDRMLRAIITAVIDDVWTTVRADLQPDQGVARALRHGISTFWGKLVEGEIGLQVMQYELAMYSVRSEGPGGLAQVQYERYTSLVSSVCEQAARAAGERCAVDFDTLGRLALAVLDGLIVQYVASPDATRARRDLDRAVDMLVMFADPRPVGGGV